MFWRGNQNRLSAIEVTPNTGKLLQNSIPFGNKSGTSPKYPIIGECPGEPSGIT